MTDTAPSWPAPPNREGVVVFDPLTRDLVDLDTAAYVSSPRAITAHSAGRWPIDDFTRELNLELIARHEAEHDAGVAFAYAVLDANRQGELGCVYLRPLDLYLSRTGTVLEGVPAGSAVATFWVVDDAGSRPSTTVVLEEILAWVDTWGVAPVVVRALPDERGSLAAVEELGLPEIRARHQELPYRWFSMAGPRPGMRVRRGHLRERALDPARRWARARRDRDRPGPDLPGRRRQGHAADLGPHLTPEPGSTL